MFLYTTRMLLSDLAGKKVCILGFGKEGKSVVGALERCRITAKVVVADKNESIKEECRSQNVECRTGDSYMNGLGDFDVIIKSPGVPPNSQFSILHSQCSTPTNIFLDEVAAIGSAVIGITGSKGKSTTTSLIYHVLKTAKNPAILCGNIGIPALDALGEITKESIVVMEMSSYQLMDATRSPHIAVLTSFFPEHLDYHASTALSTGGSPLEAYFEAKANIVRFQKKNDAVFFNAENPDTKRMAELSAGKQIGFTCDECPLPLSETKLMGDHNRSNIAGAFKVAQYLGVDHKTCLEAFRTFTPLPHRLQSLGVKHGIHWVDDAISTTPDSAIAALRALGSDVKVMILGGTDRGLEFDSLAEEIVERSQVSTVILFPGTGVKIRKSIEKYLNIKVVRKINFYEANSMEEAVKHAKDVLGTSHFALRTSPICLLSTASPSYNMFKNFEEKGDRFQECINKL